MSKEPLAPEEADQLAFAASVPVDDVLATIAPLPDDLQRELQEPRWRKYIRHRATDGDEERARSRLGYEAYQLAARETGQGAGALATAPRGRARHRERLGHAPGD